MKKDTSIQVVKNKKNKKILRSSKREQIKQCKLNESSDSNDSSSQSESEEEDEDNPQVDDGLFDSEDEESFDEQEYRELVSQIFPSKHMTNKVRAGKRLKQKLAPKKTHNKRLPSKPRKFFSRKVEEVYDKKAKNKKASKEEEEEEELEDEDEDSEELEDSCESDEDEDEEEEDSDSEEEEDAGSKKKAKLQQFNIIFTIGKGKKKRSDWDTEDEEESEDDEDYDSQYDEWDTEEDEDEEDEEDSDYVYETPEEDTSDQQEDEDEEDDNEEEEEEEEEKKPKKKHSKNHVHECATVERARRRRKLYKARKSNKASEQEDTKNQDKEKEQDTNKNQENAKEESASERTEHKAGCNDSLEKQLADAHAVLAELKKIKADQSANKTIQMCIKNCEDSIASIKKKQAKQDIKQKKDNCNLFKKQLREKNKMNDFAFFQKMDIEPQKKIIRELREINTLTRIEKPYKLTLLESDIPSAFKACAMKRINTLRYMDNGSGEFHKIKNWVDTFMKIPFGKFETLPVTIDNGVDACHEFMENALQKLDSAVYGLNDAKMQVMQMIGQLITNPQSIGTSIALKGPMGTGKTSIVKNGISKILNRPFAFIALGGATDSSFLEGHSYTYEGSTWGKIVQIIIESKCMNPVIYFDELDKISDTPKGEEIVGILTHLTDSTQNSQFHDKYFSDIEFDLSKCLFIFSYNDESKINPILRDRMYKIQTKGYDKKQKTIIANKHLLPAIQEQVKFKEGDIIIQEEALHYIIDTHCQKEEGVRNLKRCLEIIYTKLNLYRLMKPETNLFEQDITLKVEFPFTVTKQIVDKLIKPNVEQETWRNLYN